MTEIPPICMWQEGKKENRSCPLKIRATKKAAFVFEGRLAFLSIILRFRCRRNRRGRGRRQWWRRQCGFCGGRLLDLADRLVGLEDFDAREFGALGAKITAHSAAGAGVQQAQL